jgi:hypothetical protein
MCSIAAVHDLELFHLDVQTAFLYGDLDDELYVEQPESFVELDNEHLVNRNIFGPRVDRNCLRGRERSAFLCRPSVNES